MKIVTVGKGDVGSGLANLLAKAGHDLSSVGHEGGDASGADVVVVAVPYDKVGEALGNVSGLQGQIAIDATNVTGPRTNGFDSVALEVKSIIGGPTAKAFPTVFAATYDAVSSQRVKPSALFAADDAARAVVEQLIGDTGLEPVFVGPLEPGARLIEDSYDLWMAIIEVIGPYFPRYAVPGEL